MSGEPRSGRTTARTGVAIVGGGPIGLALAYLLGRQGVDVKLFEQRRETSYVLKGQYLGPTTVELFRQWGILDELVGEGWAYDRYNGAGFYETLRSGPIFDARHSERDEEGYAEDWGRIVPAAPRGVPASAYEAALRRIARSRKGVDLHYHSLVLDVETGDGGVALTVKDTDNGDLSRVEADYVVIAAGKYNPLRRQLGVGERAGPDFGARILALFHAPLRDLVGDKPYYFYRILHPDYRGLFQSEIPQNGLWSYLYTSASPGDLSHEKILRRLRGAIGDPDFPVELKDVVRFGYDTGITEKWRSGRVLFAGDAAHHHVPSGGFGVNMGLKDANNLAWKLALVVKGLAAESLLDTYEAEQRPVVERLIKLATYTSSNLIALFEGVDALEEVAFEGERSPSAAAVDALKQFYGRNELYFVHGGHLLSATYKSPAVLGYDDSLPVVALDGNYVETVRPGARAPHIWLERDGERSSLIDHLGTDFVVLSNAGDGVWEQAVKTAGGAPRIPVRGIAIGPGGAFCASDSKWSDLFDLHAGEALLIRPDGFIAARLSADTATSASEALADALTRILEGPHPRRTPRPR